jgi:hypothetical protein
MKTFGYLKTEFRSCYFYIKRNIEQDVRNVG